MRPLGLSQLRLPVSPGGRRCSTSKSSHNALARLVRAYACAGSWGERRASNPRPPGSQPGTLPTELRPPSIYGPRPGPRTRTPKRRRLLKPLRLPIPPGGEVKLLVGMARFELAASCPPDTRANQAAPHSDGVLVSTAGIDPASAAYRAAALPLSYANRELASWSHVEGSNFRPTG